MLDHIFAQSPTDVFVEIWQSQTGDRTFVSPSSLSTNSLPTGFDPATDTYFGVAARKTKGSTKEDVYGTGALWADIDTMAMPQGTLRPSIVVKSGNGWHFYWLLKKWCVDVNAIEVANKILMEDVGGDSCFNANRFLRFPGTVNTKGGNKCEVKQIRDIRYDLSWFSVVEKLDSKIRHKIRTGDRRGHRSRSERDWSIVVSLVAAGASDELIEIIFQTQPCGDKYFDPETDSRKYLEHTIGKAREHVVTTGSTKKSKVPAERGILITDEGYWMTKGDSRRQITTFRLDPTLLLEGDETTGAEDVLVCNVIHPNHIWPDVMFPRSAFNDKRGFNKLLRIAAWSFLGRDDDIPMLLPMLMSQLEAKGLPKVKSSSVLGRIGPYWVGNTQCITTNELWDGAKGPIVFFGVQRERPSLKYSLQPDYKLPIEALLATNNVDVIWPILGWHMATPYKPLIEECNIRFPMLHLCGTKGSGKTSLLRFMQNMLGFTENRNYDVTTTRFVKLTLMGSTNAVPIAFSEYRASVLEHILRYVLLAYDTGHDPRGRSDQTTQDYPLCAPFSIDGEDMIADPAARERLVIVRLDPATVREGTSANDAFKSIVPEDLRYFAGSYIQYTLSQDVPKLLMEAKDAIRIAYPEPLPDRVRNNLIVTTIGILSLCRYLNYPLPDLRVTFKQSVASVWSSTMQRGSVMVDTFCEDVVNEILRNRGTFYSHIETRGVIWFQLTPALSWWHKQRTLSHQPSLDRDAIKAQLEERLVTKEGNGQYIVSPQIVSGVWCYGLDLARAHNAGLDVPNSIAGRTLELVF